MTIDVERLRMLGLLSALDYRFAQAMARLSGERRPEVLLAAAMTSRQVGNGHVCLELERLASNPLLSGAEGEAVSVEGWPEPECWLQALRLSPLVGGDDGATPLVLDASGRLYLRRYYEHQKRLTASILERARQAAEKLDTDLLRRGLDRLFGEADGLQRTAAEMALRKPFCVLSGGPGTGKTSTVVKILALLLEQAAAGGLEPPRMTLLAPTGKAAARLTETIKRTKSELDCSVEIKRAIAEEASTIHRCLGASMRSASGFRYHAGNRLLTDLVLVDEASMVDMALMARLMEAVPEGARVILLGDKDQLASVEAGAVLGDICNACAAVDAAGAGGPLSGCAVHLTRNYRYSPGSGIELLARAVNAGDEGAALEVLRSAAYPDAVWVERSAGQGPGPELRRELVTGYRPYLERPDPVEQIRLFDGYRILCAHRRGPTGVEKINRMAAATLAREGLIAPEREFYPGRPIMVIRNDYQQGLFNGDVGLLYSPLAGDDRDQLSALFLAPDGESRQLSPHRLPAHETAFAISVHKSQGSEFDAVSVLLADFVSPVISRELLYTAATRARRRVVIHAPEKVLRAAVSRPVQRASGLTELLLEMGNRPVRARPRSRERIPGNGR